MHARVDLRKSKFRAGGHGRQSARLSRRPVGPIRCAMSSPPDGWPGGRGLVALVSEIEGKGEGRTRSLGRPPEDGGARRGALRPDGLSRDGELGCKECGDVRSGVRKFAVPPLAQ